MPDSRHNMMVFRVAPECRQLGLRAGAIVLCDVQIAEATEELRQETATEVQSVRRQFATPADLHSLPELQKLHEILRGVGVRPRSHPPSTQKLLEFAIQRGSLPRVNNLVDAYNLVSVRTRFSLGAHDLNQLALPVTLRLLRGDERFQALGDREETAVTPGEFAYVDAEQRVICRLDSRQADFSKVTRQTSQALLIIEGTVAHTPAQVDQVVADALSTIPRHCQAHVESPEWLAGLRREFASAESP